MKEELKRKRKKTTLTQQDMANMLGCSRPWYNAIENGKVIPSIEHAKKIGKKLGIDWTAFYDNKED